MPELLISVAKSARFVDGGMISAPSTSGAGIKMGLRELVDAADYGIPTSIRRSVRAGPLSQATATPSCASGRAYYEAVQETRNA